MTFRHLPGLSGMRLVLLLLLASVGYAQSAVINLDSKPATDEMLQWLESGDPRLTAWAAYFVGRSGDQEVLPELVIRVEHWEAPPKDAPDRGRQFKAMNAMLDAVIQQNASLSADGVLAISDLFPAQAAILTNRLEEQDRLRVLTNWYGERSAPDSDPWSDQSRRTLARVAAMMLVKHPPPGFAAAVVNEAEVHLQTTIHNPGDLTFGVGNSSCCGIFGVPDTDTDLPPVFMYQLGEYPLPVDDLILVSAGGATVSYRRSKWVGGSACSQVRPLDGETRLELIAEMLGVSVNDVGWKAKEYLDVSVETGRELGGKIQQLVAAQEAKLNQTVQTLAQRGVLSEEEAQRSRPRLEISLHDQRSVRAPELPRFVPADARTTITLGQGPQP